MAERASIVRKISMSPTSSWIKLDANGQCCLLDVDKYHIMRQVQIDARDFRILDPLLSYPSTILAREKAIVLNLEHIKAIITAEEVFLQDPTDEDVVPVVEELQRRLTMTHKDYTSQHDIEVDEENDSPFEFRALEVIFEAICSFLAARTSELEMDVYPALDELTTQISSRNLDKVRKLKSTMTGLIARVQKVKDELEQLMDDDDDMADLYLSRKLEGALASPVRQSGDVNWSTVPSTIESKPSKASVETNFEDENDVEELEMLLEAYFMQIDGTLNKLTTLRGYVDDTEDYINIHIDNHRNQLIQLELFLNSGDLSLSFYALVTAIFGMSIPYPWNQNHSYLFKWVVIFAGVFSVIIFLVVVAYARKKGLIGS